MLFGAVMSPIFRYLTQHVRDVGVVVVVVVVDDDDDVFRGFLEPHGLLVTPFSSCCRQTQSHWKDLRLSSPVADTLVDPASNIWQV